MELTIQNSNIHFSKISNKIKKNYNSNTNPYYVIS